MSHVLSRYRPPARPVATSESTWCFRDSLANGASRCTHSFCRSGCVSRPCTKRSKHSPCRSTCARHSNARPETSGVADCRMHLTEVSPVCDRFAREHRLAMLYAWHMDCCSSGHVAGVTLLEISTCRCWPARCGRRGPARCDLRVSLHDAGSAWVCSTLQRCEVVVGA